MKTRIVIHDALVSLSLLNVLLIRRWAELFTVANEDAYYLKLTRADFAGTILALIAAAVSITAIAQLVRAYGFTPPALARSGGRITARGMLVLAPFLLLTVPRAAWYAWVEDLSRFSDRAPPLGAAPASAPGPRVIVLLFDAMGREIAFDRRPAGVSMPSFDRMRGESLDASAVRKAGGHTREAVPGFLSGVQPYVAYPVGPDELLLELTDGSVENWASLPNAFRAAQEVGGVATVAGWYHPYCRIFPELDGCSAFPASNCGGQVDWTLPAAIASTLRDTSPFTMYRDRHVRAYRAVMREAAIAVTRPGRGLTFVHLPAPHAPAIWSRRRGALTAFNFRTSGDEDQLELADHALRDLRETMERAGTWDSSTVLVTADHPAGGANRRHEIEDDDVPFLLKLPGQTERVAYAAPFSAATGFPLIRALVTGSVSTPEEAATWLDRNALGVDLRILEAAMPGEKNE